MDAYERHHILLLGGTGACGLLFTRAALEAGHTLTLYVRTPSKIPTDLLSNPRLHTIEGNLQKKEGLKEAAACGADIFVSLAGPTLGRKDGTPIADALNKLYPMLLEAKTFKRVMILSTASYTAPEDVFSLKWFMAINCYIKVLGGDTYSEIVAMAKETVQLGENIDWTVFRVPLLRGNSLDTEESKGDVNAVFVGEKRGRDGLTLDRGRLARWILGELYENKWSRLCPLLSNA